MFSSDERKIRVAELKSKGDGGTIQRLRKSCADAATIMDHAANIVAAKHVRKADLVALANEMHRGAVALRGMARFSAPKGSK